MVRWEDDLLLAGVVAEDGGFVDAVLPSLVSSFPALLDGGRTVRFRIFAFAYLNHRAAASPTVRRKELVPERVGWRKGDTMQHAVFGAYTVVVCRPVLQIVAVAVFLELLPFGGHLC